MQNARPYLAPLLLGISMLCACDDASESSGDNLPEFAEDLPGQWYVGDLHVHATGASNDTGGDSYPEDIAAMAQARGLDFVVLTDHSNSTGSDPTTTEEDPELFNQGPEFVYWDEAAALSSPSFILVSGNEISPVESLDSPNEPRGHIGCIPRTLDESFDTDSPFVDRPVGVVSGGDVLEQALERNCFAIVNHPYAITPHIAFDWTGEGYHGIEVWNGTANGLDSYDLQGWNAWRCDLLAGRRVTPIAASDNHRVNIEPPGDLLNPALGRPVTAVRAATLTWDAIIAGLLAGDVALFEGDSRLFIDSYNAEGAHAQGSAVRYIRLRGTLDADARNATLRLRRATACEDPRPTPITPPTVTDEVIFEASVAPGEAFDHAVQIAGEPGVYTAELLTGTPSVVGGAPLSALSTAVVISAATAE